MTTSGQEHTGRARGGRGRFTRSIDTAQRDGQACELRAQGLTYDTIATRLGYADRSTAHQAVERALAATLREPGDALRFLEGQRLDGLWRTAWDLLDADDLELRLKAIDRCVRISERRAKLYGLDAPTRIETISVDQIDAEIARLTAQLAVEP